MKKKYAAPEVDTLIFETEDLIMVSGEFDKNPTVAKEDLEDTRIAE